MKKILLLPLLLVMSFSMAFPSDPPPVIGLCIAAPGPDNLEQFIGFMENELAPGGINTLVLRVDYNYSYTSYPNLRAKNPLKEADVKQLVASAKKHGIELIPQVNLLGHQSWASRLGNLLQEYPEFDENPSVGMPEDYEWPNEDGLYCKSYCPLHPDVHEVVFALVDEIMEVFEAVSFHAGMDEVFYIGEDECPRCNGKNKAELFANEVNKIQYHLEEKGQNLWIWGDRLIDGHTTGLGMWEASENDTHQSIDLISKNVLICDWHYERADPTAALFALKGFEVLTCPWRNPQVTQEQLTMLESFRMNSTEEVKDRYHGIMQTVWSPAGSFLEQYYKEDSENGQVQSLKEIIQFYKK